MNEALISRLREAAFSGEEAARDLEILEPYFVRLKAAIHALWEDDSQVTAVTPEEKDKDCKLLLRTIKHLEWEVKTVIRDGKKARFDLEKAEKYEKRMQ